SKIECNISSLLLKYRYTVPSAIPASPATSATFELKKPFPAKILIAARKIASRLSAIRIDWATGFVERGMSQKNELNERSFIYRLSQNRNSNQEPLFLVDQKEMAERTGLEPASAFAR